MNRRGAGAPDGKDIVGGIHGGSELPPSPTGWRTASRAAPVRLNPYRGYGMDTWHKDLVFRDFCEGQRSR